ncbi:MAG: hypothetical protein Q9163_000749 [Psora crenata]
MHFPDPSPQLQENLWESVQAALNTKRPIITHLNADTTWLLQLPYPSGRSRPPGRSRFNVLIDPWLRGKQSDVAFWFSSQWHSIDASVQTIHELEEILRANEGALHGSGGPVEQLDSGGVSIEQDLVGYRKREKDDNGETWGSLIDAVVVSHEFTDHCHKQTLLEVHPATPVFATNRAATLIRSWGHFNTVSNTPTFSSKQLDWRLTSLSPLPSWLGISSVASECDALYFHSAILFTFDLTSGKHRETPPDLKPPDHNTLVENQVSAESLVYTPHGIPAQDLRCLATANPPLRTLALLHGLHDIQISLKQLNLGAHNGLRAQRICDAKYWISTHDEVKKASGFITTALRRKKLTLEEALAEEKRRGEGVIDNESQLAAIKEVTFADLKSGESLLLS